MVKPNTPPTAPVVAPTPKTAEYYQAMAEAAEARAKAAEESANSALAQAVKAKQAKDAAEAELAKRGKATVKRDTWSDAPDVAPVSFTILMDDGTTVGPYAFSRTADGASTWRENPETGKGGAYAGCKPTIGGRAFTGGLNLSPKASK